MIDLRSLAMPLPQDIESHIAAGDWQAAEQMIAARLQLDLPQMQQERLKVARFFLGRLRADYPMDRGQLLTAIREQIPAFDEEDLNGLRDLGWLDSRMIDGKRMYFEDTVASLLKANPEFAARAGKPLSPSRPLLDDAMLEMKRQGSLEVPMRLQTRMVVKPQARRADTAYRVHLTLPLPAPQQQDVKIEDISPNPQHIGRESAAQRTAYFEGQLPEDGAYAASSSWVHRLTYCDPLSLNGQRVLYPQAKAPTKEDLEPQAPHMLFTPYLVSLCRELAGDEVIPVRKAKRFYDFITGKVLYSYVRPYLLIENGAEYAALNLRGDCGLQALLFITLCRIAGIPARWQSGLYAAPGDEGSHDWAWFHTEAWGWLPADCSFGGAARRGGNAQRREFYFGNLDPYRAVFNQQYFGDFQPPRLHMRNDPYDNQRGEIETVDGPLVSTEYSTRHTITML